MAYEVEFLRHFRDDTMVKLAGQEFRDDFNDFYYSFSPQTAQLIREHSWIRPIITVAISPYITMLHGFDEMINWIL